ncbi:MAG: MBL fold metallo-hydrolase [Spirochaetia bacterium]|nr:MBL fold metallo-hydrolase [Spirochaetia bacterium]
MESIQFLGATGTVTGSKFLLTFDDYKILVDCGLFQGLKKLRLKNWNPLEVPPEEIQSVVLTHAHIDHSGYIPLLVKNGFKGKIYATEATKALCDILLPDSGHIQEEDAEFANRHKFSRHSPALPLYTEEDARNSLNSFHIINWKNRFKLNENLGFEYYQSGHILGSGIVKFYAGKKSITFTGDLGRQKNIIMKKPERVSHTDYLVIESTYGDEIHSDEDPAAILEKAVTDTIKKGGKILIPAFAVGRTQQLLYLINKIKIKNPSLSIPVYVDSPMASRSTQIFFNYTDEHAISKEECDTIRNNTKLIAFREDSIAIMNSPESSVIISASGMATGGRVLHHLASMLPDKKNTILFTGFQAAGTRGKSLVGGKKSVKIHGEFIPVRADIMNMNVLSAHADSDEIMQWLYGFEAPPRLTFIVHGEPQASDELRKRIESELKWKVEIPELNEKFSL